MNIMIFWINSPFDPLPMEGGRPMRYELLAQAFVALGHDVVWWSSDFHHLRKEKRSLKPVFRCDGYEVRLVPTLPYASNVSWRRVLSHRRYALEWRKMAVEALNSKELLPPDVIVLSMPPLGLFDQAALFRDALGCRIVVDIQDAWPENFVYLVPRALQPLVRLAMPPLKKAAQRVYRGANLLTAVAAKYLSLAESYGAACPGKNFPLGAVLPDISGHSNKTSGKLKLVYVGNFGPSYDLKTMLRGVIELVNEGCDLSLDIAGDGPRRDEVEEAVKNSDGRIRFYGYLPAEDLFHLMNECDIGIIPMRDEMLVAVPNKLVDYACHGLGIVNGLTTESKALLEKYDCGVAYESGNLQSFKDAVVTYHGNRKMLKNHKKNSRIMAEDLFDASMISSEMARWILRNCDH